MSNPSAAPRTGISGDAGTAPWNRYYRDGDELRPAPARVRPTAAWTEARRRLYGKYFPVLEVPRETPLTLLAADQLWEGDRFMDPVAALFKTRGPRARAMLEQALEHGIETVENPPQELIDLFEHLDRVPDWVDWEKFERGRQLAADTSLPSSAAQVILDALISVLGTEVSMAAGATGRVIKDAARRNLETIDWLYQITLPGAFDRNGKAFKDTVRVRLMHALVRGGLIKKWGPEFLARHGNPISSAHMAFGASTFGLSMLLFDMKAGRRYSRDDLDAVAMYWGYVVYVFGANEAVIPKNAEDNMRFGDYMMMTMGDPSEFTPELVRKAVFGLLAPLAENDKWIIRSLAQWVGFPVLLGYIEYIVGPGLVREIVQYSPYDRELFGWEPVGRAVARTAALHKRVVDLLPGAAARRAERVRAGDPFYRPVLGLLNRMADSAGTGHSGYTSHDDSATGAGFAARASA